MKRASTPRPRGRLVRLASMVVVAALTATVGVLSAQPASAATITVAGCGTYNFEPALHTKYAAMGGATGHLGCPTGNSYTTWDGRYRVHDFRGGSLYWPFTVAGSQPVSILEPIRHKWATMNWEKSHLGYPTIDTWPIYGPNNELGLMNQFEGGMIFSSTAGTYEVRGAILQKMMELGVARVGFPRSDELGFTEGGRVSQFTAGQIYWWPDTGAIPVLGRIRVSYAGLYMHDRTDDQIFDSHDEPYAMISAVWPGTSGNKANHNTPEYSVGGSSDCKGANVQLYVGAPNGITLGSTVMEHDHGDKAEIRSIVEGATRTAAAAVAAKLTAVPVVGPALAVVGAPLLQLAATELASYVNSLIGDEHLGSETRQLSAKQLVTLAGAPARTQGCITYKVASRHFTNFNGDYQTFFNVTVVP